MSINVAKLSYSIGDKKILNDLSFTLNAGEITAVIGENGAGKSSLFNCLAGVSKFDGLISLNGQAVDRMSLAELAKYRAVLPQNSNLSFPFSVDEVVRLAMSLGSLSHQEQEAIIVECLSLLDAVQFIDRNYTSLSGGEKQRVQIARVLAQLCAHKHQGDQFLFLDEPTSALDLKHQYATLKMLNELSNIDSQARKIGVIVIVHDLNLASLYCDKVLLIDDGRLIKHDTPECVLNTSLIKSTFDIDVIIDQHPNIPKPYVIPRLLDL